MDTKQQTPQARYDAAHTTNISIKLNHKTDADIITVLTAQQNRQGYIKRALRAYKGE